MKAVLLIGFILLGLYITPTLAEQPPSGDYKKTCTNISVSIQKGVEVLTATCLRLDGTPQSTTLWFANHCATNIHNIDGTLTCSCFHNPILLNKKYIN